MSPATPSTYGPTAPERFELLVLSLVSNVLALLLPLALLQVYDRILPNQAQGTALVIFSAVLIALVLDGILRFVRFRSLARIGARYEFASLQALVTRVLAAQPAELARLGPGRLRAAVGALGQSRELYSGQGLLPLFDAPFGVAFIFFVWYIGGSLVLVPLLLLALLGLLVWSVGPAQRRNHGLLAEAEQQRVALLGEAFGGLETLKSLGLSGLLFQRFAATERRRALASEQSERLAGLFTDLSQTGAQAATIAIALAGSLVALRGDMTTGGLAACSLLGGRGIGSLLGLLGAMSRRQLARAAEEQVMQVLALAPRHDGATLAGPAGSGALGLRLDGFTLQRAGAAVKGLSAQIPPGAIVAVELDRRADSELLLQGVCGLEPLDAGTLDHWPAEGADRRGPLASHAAFVPARPAIFAGTVLDNLCLFDERLRPRAKALAEEIGLIAMTDRLPKGLLTEVGYEALPSLPDGAIKRIGIVRALIRQPGVLALQSPARWLDADGITRLAAMLQARRAEMTVLLATADPKLRALADLELRSTASGAVLTSRSEVA